MWPLKRQKGIRQLKIFEPDILKEIAEPALPYKPQIQLKTPLQLDIGLKIWGEIFNKEWHGAIRRDQISLIHL